MNTILDSVHVSAFSSSVEKYRDFVDRYAGEFERFGVDSVKAHKTCRVAWAMAQDLLNHGVTPGRADFHALMAMTAILVEGNYSLLDAGPRDFADPLGRLAPLRIYGYADVQARWLEALNLRQILHWQASGVGDFGLSIVRARESIAAAFNDDEIDSYDLLAESGDPAMSLWMG